MVFILFNHLIYKKASLLFLKMLGVFRRDGKKHDPLAPELPGPEYTPAFKDDYLEKYFASIYSQHVIVGLGTHGFMAYSTDKNISPSPKPMFCMRGGIYCIYRGSMKMMEDRKKAGEGGNELDLLIACYADVRRKGNKATFEAMQVLGGDYNYILYDSFASTERAMRGAFAVNCWKDMSVYLGLDSEGCCIIADDTNIMEKVCGDSFKLIPKGYGLLIPVLVQPKLEPIVVSSSDDSGSDKESEGEPNTADGNSSKKGSGAVPNASSNSGGSVSKKGRGRKSSKKK